MKEQVYTLIQPPCLPSERQPLFVELTPTWLWLIAFIGLEYYLLMHLSQPIWP